MKRTEVEAIVARVGCESCGAKPGDPCINGGRRFRAEAYRNSVHEPRRQAYQARAMVKAGYEIVGIVLKDLDRGRSITNDAEAVVAEIAAAYPGRRIFYYDTDDILTELVHVDGRFTEFKFTDRCDCGRRLGPGTCSVCDRDE